MHLRNKGNFVFCLLQVAGLWATSAQAVILHAGGIGYDETPDTSNTHLFVVDIRIPSGLTLTITLDSMFEIQALSDDQGKSKNTLQPELVVDGGRRVIAETVDSHVTLKWSADGRGLLPHQEFRKPGVIGST